MGSFWGVGKLWFCGWRRDFRGAAGWAFELDAVSVVPKAVDGCRGERRAGGVFDIAEHRAGIELRSGVHPSSESQEQKQGHPEYS